LHKNRDETEEMLVSVVFGTAVLIASLMSVSQIPTPRAISSPPRSWKLTKRRKEEIPRACLEQRRTFTPFVVSTDGLIGKEAKTLLKKLSTMAEK
jgi:hypothetical protein